MHDLGIEPTLVYVCKTFTKVALRKAPDSDDTPVNLLQHCMNNYPYYPCNMTFYSNV